MPLATLQNLGLSINEAKIYEALLDLNEASVGQIASKTKLHRRNIYDALNRLTERGIVFPELTKGKNHYLPADPSILSELLSQKRGDLNKILPDLKKRYINRQGLQEAYIYRGIEGFKNYMRDILRVGKNGYFIGAKFGWFGPELKNFTQEFLKKAKQKNIIFYHIFDHEVRKGSKSILKKLGPNYRFLPPKYSTHSACDIFGDYVVTLTYLRSRKIKQDAVLFVLRDKQLAASYRKWFQFIYDNCPKN